MSNQPTATDRAAPGSHFAAVVPAAQTILPTVSGTSVSGASGTSLSATTGTGMSTTTVGGKQVPG